MNASPPAGGGGAGRRLFLALWPGAPLRRELAHAGAALDLGRGGVPVPPGNLHLTVAFIGAVDEQRLADVRRIGAALRAPPLTVTLDTYEYWPKPQVVVALAQAVPAPLQALWDDVHARLAADRFELRVKKLRPHVTLARRVADPPALPPLVPLVWTATDWCLVQSDAGPDGAVYTVLDTWSLLDRPVAH